MLHLQPESELFPFPQNGILDKARSTPQFSGDDNLRDHENDQISILQILPIVFKDVEILGGGRLIPKGGGKKYSRFRGGKSAGNVRLRSQPAGFLH